jgi:hypothetical protein
MRLSKAVCFLKKRRKINKMLKYSQVKLLLENLEKIQDCLYSFFYELKAPKVGCFLGTPFYELQQLIYKHSN